MLTPDEEASYLKRRDLGWTQKAAATAAGISVRTGARLDKRIESGPSGDAVRERNRLASIGAPKKPERASGEAALALNDFALFQRRYLGRIAVPWQIMAADDVVEYFESPEDEFVVINCPQGSGKSTLFTHDIPVYITCKHREIRGLIVSSTQRKADELLSRIKHTLERTSPMPPEPREFAAGRAVEAVASVSGDYGRFKPVDNTGIWSRKSITVEQVGGHLTAEKEPTWSSYGFDGDFLGGRYDIVLCDDLQDPARLRSQEQYESDRQRYIDVCESRLEPGGMLLLQGQRLGANDIYGYAKSMKSLADGDDNEDLTEAYYGLHAQPKYHQVIFKAHYEEMCTGEHTRDMKPWPESCLLYPDRLPWRKLAAMQMNKMDRYRVLMQQEDTDPDNVLINPSWINGEAGFVGCWDRDRDRAQLPTKRPDGSAIDLRDCISVITADPSPTKYWGIEWWVVDTVTQLRYLVDLEKKAMDAPDFLEAAEDGPGFHGLLENWWVRSNEMGVPVKTVIVEDNAAQTFLLQYSFVHRWMLFRGVNILRQTTTGKNKLDDEYGIQMLKGIYQFGKVRLPGAGMGRAISLRLRDEVTRYPDTPTTDLTMAQWFLEYHLPELLRRHRRVNVQTITEHRPSWLADDVKSAERILGIKRQEPQPSRAGQLISGLANR